MKQLIRLARKYLLRQKYRTALTFACVMLSVFVFHLLCMAATLIRGAAIGNIAQETGLWEVNIQSWLAQMDEPEKAYPILREHPNQESYQLFEFHSWQTSDARDAEGYVPFLTFAVNTFQRNAQSISFSATEGDSALSGKTEDLAFGAGSMRYDLAADEILLPADCAELGIQEGDTVTLTITPKRGRLSEDNDFVQSYIAALLEQHPEYAGVPYFSDSEGVSQDTTVLFGMPLRTFLTQIHQTTAIEYTDVVSGTPITAQMRVAGFFAGGTDYYYSDGAAMQVVTAVDTALGVKEQLSASFAEIGADENTVQENSVYSAGFRVAEGLHFDDAVEEIFLDLGMPEDLILDLVHPVDLNTVYNTSLLALEFRGMDAANTWLSNFLPVVVALVVLALMLWALMRFVIENAFEISVQERSAQFATLRVMGASRKQVAVLVFAEALFYSVTAVPLGMLLAFVCKQLIALAVTRAGILLTDTQMPVLTAASLLLAWLAVFISAYTSSMWAARAYSPLEATRRSDLRGSKAGKQTAAEKQAVQQKKMQQAGDLKTPQNAKLNRKHRAFLLHYTLRNIRRTRKRFLIAVITLTMGCAVFSFGLSAGAWALMEIHGSDAFSADFLITQKSYSSELPDLVAEQFGNDPDFADYRITVLGDTDIDTEAFSADFADLIPVSAIEWLQPHEDAESGEITQNTLELRILPRRDYEADYEALTGLSYDELTDSGAAILCCGTSYTNEETGTELEYPAGWQTVQGAVGVQLAYADFVPVCGVLCSDQYQDSAALLISEEGGEAVLNYYLLNAAYLGQQAIRTEIRLALADSKAYTSGKETVSSFVNDVLSRFRGEVSLTDQFASHTGRHSLLVTIGSICLIALIALWGAGISTMLNTINTGVLNRCEELMTLHKIGMSQKQMRRTVSLESIVYCAISTVIGGFLGIAGCVYMMLHSAFEASPLRVFAILLSALLVTLLVNILIAWIAARPGLRELNRRLAEGGAPR